MKRRSPAPRLGGHSRSHLLASLTILLIVGALTSCGTTSDGSGSASASDPDSTDTGGSGLLAALELDGPMPLVRTDFSDDAAWQRVIAMVSASSEEDYTPNVEPIDNPDFAGATGEALTALAGGEQYGYLALADARSMRESSGGELTLVLLDLSVDPLDADELGWVYGREFRSAVTAFPDIEANLSIANMDFDEFADGVDEDGVFRGFGSEDDLADE